MSECATVVSSKPQLRASAPTSESDPITDACGGHRCAKTKCELGKGAEPDSTEKRPRPGLDIAPRRGRLLPVCQHHGCGFVERI